MNSSKPIPPARKHFAAGDYLSRFPDTEPYALLIEAAFPKPGWKQRMLSQDGKTTFPGTAILFEDRYYEIILEEEGSGKNLYYLNPWEDRFPIRVQFPYTPEECLRVSNERKAEQQKQQQTVAIYLLLPLFGLLPAADQMRLEHEYGIRAAKMTSVSAWLLFMVGGYFSILTAAAAFTGGVNPVQVIGCYFLPESLIRLIQTTKLDEPAGSFPVVLPIEIYRAIKRQFDPAYRQRSLERMESRRHRKLYLDALDKVTETQKKDYDLEILSDLPKPHWSESIGISYKDTWYFLFSTEEIREEKKVLYRFRLKKASEGMVFRNTAVYTAEEIRELYREKRHRDLSTWVDTFCLLWGLLPGEDQRALKDRYEFDGVKYTKWTATALGIFGAGSMVTSLISLTAGFSMTTEFLWFLVSFYLVVESAIRWDRAAKGNPEGSVLGILLRPLAARFMNY